MVLCHCVRNLTFLHTILTLAGVSLHLSNSTLHHLLLSGGYRFTLSIICVPLKICTIVDYITQGATKQWLNTVYYRNCTETFKHLLWTGTLFCWKRSLLPGSNSAKNVWMGGTGQVIPTLMSGPRFPRNLFRASHWHLCLKKKTMETHPVILVRVPHSISPWSIGLSAVERTQHGKPFPLENNSMNWSRLQSNLTWHRQVGKLIVSTKNNMPTETKILSLTHNSTGQ